MIDVQARLNRYMDDLRKVKAYRSVLKAQRARLSAEEELSKVSADKHQRCSEIFKRWLEDSLDKNVHSMADLATIALRHVIPDQKLQLKIVQEPRYNRMAMRFLLEEEDPRGGVIEGDPLNSYGGGASAIISLVLRLSVMSRMKMGNLLLLDESMAFVGPAYIPATASFMRRLSESTGVNILMVTHSPEFMANAHVAYEGHKDGSLRLRRLKVQDSP